MNLQRKLALTIAVVIVLIAGFGTSPSAFPVFRPTSQVSRAPDNASPRIAALEKQLATDPQAAAQFWKDLSKEGTPIIETIADDSRNALVTFVWRGADDLRNVVVFGFTDSEPYKNQLTRLQKTDIWYKTYRISKQARLTYIFSLNDSLVPFDELDPKDLSDRAASFKLDPLNHRGAMGGGSIVELPDVSPQPWNAIQADIPHGKLEAATVKSAILKNERRAWVYTPPGYQQSGTPYPLIVMFDGPMYTLLIPSARILDNLISRDRVAPMVALVLDNPTAKSRDTEFACYEPYAEFIAKEAIPWVRRGYNVSTEPALTYVSGVSYGGLAAAYVGFKHPDVFGNVISQSGSFWYTPSGDSEPEWLTRQFVTSPKLPLRFHLDVGLLERLPTPGRAPDMVSVNRHFRDVLLAKGYSVDYREYIGGHDAISWRGLFAEALIALGPKRGK
ncbi:MAG TPA: alpha/beta hydrolase-fold protein [Blastocatellia bacterium]|nr:alpha/beta hydrolase-fold protein [Blastocatellia bacterium]